MENVDLVIAGAGPGGCALAAKVAGEGSSVVVLEKEREPGLGRDWVVDVAGNAFDEARVPAPDEGSRWREPEVTFMTTSSLDFELRLNKSPLLPVRNGRYVKQLARWAASNGADIRTGFAVTGPLMEAGYVGGVAYRDESGRDFQIGAKIVADATGLVGAVRRGTPSGWGLADRVAEKDIVLARREVRKVDREAAGEAALRDGRLKDGSRVDRAASMGAYSIETTYLDLEEGFIDILVGVKPGGGRPTADEAFAAYVGKMPFVGEKVFGDGGPIPIRRTWDSLVGDGLILLGDSACQVIPAHGSGTASALIAADIASRTVLEALSAGRYDRSALWGYCRDFQRGRGAVLAYYYAVRCHTDGLEGDDVDVLLRKGILGPDDVRLGLLPEPFKASPAALLKKVSRGLTVLPLLVGFARSGIKATRMMRHYRDYPETFDSSAVEAWERGLPRVG